MLTYILIFIALVGWIIYVDALDGYKFFTRIGVEFVEPTFPYGSFKDVVDNKHHFYESAAALYKTGKAE